MSYSSGSRSREKLVGAQEVLLAVIFPNMKMGEESELIDAPKEVNVIFSTTRTAIVLSKMITEAIPAGSRFAALDLNPEQLLEGR